MGNYGTDGKFFGYLENIRITENKKSRVPDCECENLERRKFNRNLSASPVESFPNV
jgi:hypothetical protein